MVSPGLVVTTWAAGIAAGAAAVVLWRVSGRGFTWLAAGVAGAIGAGGALAAESGTAWVGVAAAAAAALLAGHPALAAASLGIAAMSFGAASATEGGVILSFTGAAALGGVTDEMLLGHWYLVDPRLQRRPLRRLAAIGMLGLVADGLALVALGALRSADPLFSWAFAIAAPLSVLLMAGVWFSLREPAYQGVMAATGLSYLALLTTLAATALGRVAVGGLPGAG